MEFLAWTSHLLAKITLTLISSFAITGYFQKVNFQGSNLVILKVSFLCGNNSVLVKIKDSLLCVINRCKKVTSKLILPSVSRFKFCPPW